MKQLNEVIINIRKPKVIKFALNKNEHKNKIKHQNIDYSMSVEEKNELIELSNEINLSSQTNFKKRLNDEIVYKNNNKTEINEIINILNKPLIYNMPKKRFSANKLDVKHISMTGRVFHDSIDEKIVHQ